MQTPWAILLVKFADDDAEPYERERYEEIFTSAGSGKWNMVDYFRDVSHGRLDLSGSKVFGWYTLDKASTEYAGSGANPAGRAELIDWARAAARRGVGLDDYFSVVVVLNQPIDLFGGVKGAVCGDDASMTVLSGLSPSLLGQEMGHVYGLQHSRIVGSVTDGTDPYDVMSTMKARMAPHPVYTDIDLGGQPVFRIGPGLNAANMASQGWLDESRVWTSPSPGAVNATVTLRPLHRADLPGALAARFGDLLVEFRDGTGWDADMQPCVLVHRFDGGVSYLVRADDGANRFLAGSTLATPADWSVLGSSSSMHVTAIDAAAKTATISIRRTPARLPQEFPPEGPWQTPWIKWLESIGGSDAVLLLDGRPVVIPRNSPMHELLDQIALYERSNTLGLSRFQSSMRDEALSNIERLARDRVARLRFRSPTPPEE